ncbi:glycosyl transferase family 1 [Cereibacter changlensis JA139]|uniref:Glycosyl transferase family 1 n=2 Tax=Cereibacter changlensis TaxID=402884 RepID=A0A2T4JP59_9RHOB|nr:glycosyltransferase family 4 protein [Cereibacter changlensis]PTE19681.1 glycosyl transferase family 1 [Cereibacter changlensis JA139]PZX48362.1 hypothetical protein LX76_04309 [Cereibacter changlensis]
MIAEPRGSTTLESVPPVASVGMTVLNRYSRLGASSRLRTIQYAAYLEATGIEAAFQPLFGTAYLERLYAGQPKLAEVLKSYARRATQLARSRHADILWLEKEALPWLPWIIERAFLPARVPLVVDYDDAVFHRYDLHRSALVRGLLGHKLDHLMGRAALVTAGNHYLADRAYAAGAKRVEIVPTVVDLNAYSSRSVAASGEVTTIGWIGTPSTWCEYMAPMMPLMSALAGAAGARITAVGAGLAAAEHSLLNNLAWTEDTEVARIRAMDIGVMPLTDTPWARGKCGYKLIQYMACGLPVIASPVGVNAEIVEHGINGLLASTDAEWNQALSALLRDPEMRARMGREGRRKVEREYSLEVWGPRVAKLLSEIPTKKQAGNR